MTGAGWQGKPLTDPTRTGWAELERIGPATEELRRIRYLADELFAEIPDENLAVAMRFFRSASFSAHEASRKMARILRNRHVDEPDFDPDQIVSAVKP